MSASVTAAGDRRKLHVALVLDAVLLVGLLALVPRWTDAITLWLLVSVAVGIGGVALALVERRRSNQSAPPRGQDRA